MKIAIVDDLEQDRASLHARLDEYLKHRGLSCEYMEFKDAEQFLAYFHPGIFDIVFLDIYMNKMNGMEAAQTVFQQDNDCRIIFLSSTPDFSLQSYAVHAVYYLVKPVEKQMFEQAMEFCCISPKYKVARLTVQSGGSFMELDTERILYIDYRSRTANIHLSDRTFPVSGSFRNVTAALEEDSRFLLCIRGLMVNMQHISCQKDDTFLLSNGERIPINIRNKKAVSQAYHNYVFGLIGGNR